MAGAISHPGSALTADSVVERMVQQLIERCIMQRASDLHLEPCDDGYRVRIRQLGQLSVAEHLNSQLAPRVVAHVKVLAQLDITERRLPQDGRCRFHVRGQQIDCRVNTVPTLWGEKLVLRLLGLTAEHHSLSAAGMLPSQQAIVERCLAKREGLILTTGPTGSGKTQTLYTLLQQLNDTSRNISTVEDPVEVDLPGVNQINVQPVLGFNFAQALRALMRQDPDVIMVGEIRDTETAGMACQAAQTGHLVFATLHAASPLSALVRLQQLGIDGYQLAGSLLLLMNQRLITLRDIGADNSPQQRRIGVYEMVPMRDALRMALLANPNHAHYWQQVDEACASDLSLQEATNYHTRSLLAAATEQPEVSHV
ncbi:MAG: type II/IV secretion system protein [Idiomarina sp.]|nr:type II/IV secretion system protein [Idiomarina sp.]